MNDNYKGCLMITLDIPKWEEYISNYVLEEDIFQNETGDYGFSNGIHCTILSGLKNKTDLEKIKKVLKPNHKIKIQFENMSIFENEEYDILKFGVNSLELKLLNATIKEKFDYQNDYPESEPHMTIAYLKSGTGKKYVKEIQPFELRSSKYHFSTLDEKGEKLHKYFEIHE